mgnify:CR=1 FL=1
MLNSSDTESCIGIPLSILQATAPGFFHENTARPVFAGQLTGLEGYLAAMFSGLLGREERGSALQGRETLVLPRETMMGALSHYISDESVKDFQPMGANFGILPPLQEPIRDKRRRYGALSERSLERIEKIINSGV